MRALTVLLGLVLICALLPVGAQAQYYKPPESDLDPSIMVIDEKKFLGAKLDGNVPLITKDGKEVPLSSFLGQPLILVLAYYTCDGSCSVINHELIKMLDDVKRVQHGKDYRILTLSFDNHDNLKTTGAFRRKLEGIEKYKDSWTLATFKNEADLKAQTAKIGFKFFWSPQDRLFLHPGAFLFFSPEGRLIRILYPSQADAGDVDLALLDARQGQFRPQEIINFAISLCYSYNYQDGKYTLSIPIFVGFGALGIGITTLFSSLYIYRRRQQKILKGEIDEAQSA
ncbi:MAG: SCO family protein [bacterium]|nr:SCO family protein [bacterium]